MFKLRRIISAVLLCSIMAFSSINLGFAATATDKKGGSGVQVSPTRSDLSVLPGEQKEFSVTVKNVTQGPITVKSFFNDFESDNISGEPKIIVDPNRQLPNSMKSFVKGVSDFTLESNETREVKLTVDVPANATPGGYYGALRFAAIPQGTADTPADTQVSLTASVASLVFVEVSGNITEQIQVDSVKVLNGDKASSLFFKQPDKVNVAITNKGNSFSKPFGRVAVTRGSTEVFAYELNNKDPRGTILPNSSRTFNDEVKNVNKFGRYTVTASISHGQGGEVIIQKASFWYIPTWVLIVAAVVLLLLIGAVIYMYRKLGKKRRK